MEKSTYDRLATLCTMLKNRFSETRFEFRGFYKVYKNDLKIVQDENLDTLKRFQDISFKEIYKSRWLGTISPESEYLSIPLVKIEKEEVLISHELELIIHYFLVDKFSKSIKEFVENLIYLETKYKGFIKIDKNESIISVKRSISETFFNELNHIENSNFVWHLFSSVASGIIYSPDPNSTIIKIGEIQKALDTSDHYQFDIIDQKFQTVIE